MFLYYLHAYNSKKTYNYLLHANKNLQTNFPCIAKAMILHLFNQIFFLLSKITNLLFYIYYSVKMDDQYYYNFHSFKKIKQSVNQQRKMLRKAQFQLLIIFFNNYFIKIYYLYFLLLKIISNFMYNIKIIKINDLKSN